MSWRAETIRNLLSLHFFNQICQKIGLFLYPQIQSKRKIKSFSFFPFFSFFDER